MNSALQFGDQPNAQEIFLSKPFFNTDSEEIFSATIIPAELSTVSFKPISDDDNIPTVIGDGVDDDGIDTNTIINDIINEINNNNNLISIIRDRIDLSFNDLTDVEVIEGPDNINSMFVSTNRSSSMNSANNNIAIGNGALKSITRGDNNVSIGINSGEEIKDGSDNIAIGLDTLKNTINNSRNVAIGTQSGTNLNTANNNVLVGYNSGSNLTSGGNNIVIGSNANASSNSVSNEITLGDSNVITLRCGATTIASLSDKRDKTEIKETKYGLNFINKLRPVEFTWAKREESILNGKKRVGFIAQELLDAMEENENDILDLVHTTNPDRLEAKYGNLLPIMVKAIQELSDIIKNKNI